MMRRFSVIWFLGFLTLLTVACRRELNPVEEPARLYIYLNIPEASLTRADIGEVESELAAENTIKDLRIWVFLGEDLDANHTTSELLGYINPINADNTKDPLTNFENRYHIPLSAEMARIHPKVDVYALANGPSFLGNNTPGEGATRAVLDELVFSGSNYGIRSNGEVARTTPSGSGLPFSGVKKGLSMQGAYPVMSVDPVTVKRAVSKFRFLFSQLVDEAGPVMGEVAIQELTIDGGIIAKKEFVFNDSANPWKISASDGYDPTTISITPPTSAEIAQNPSPKEYAYKPGMSAAEYEALTAQGLSSGVLTSWGRCYLRETDKPVSGKIKYTIGGAPGEATFQMQDAGGFARNHTWTVYAYFLRDEMQFTVSWTPWESGSDFNLSE